MRLIVKDKEESTEGILVRKDSSFLAIRLPNANVRVWHWSHIENVKRIYKGKEFEVNLEAMRKGRE